MTLFRFAAVVVVGMIASAGARAGARVAVVVHTTGFADDDAKKVQDKVAQEVTSTGAELWALSKSLEIKTECLADHACAKEVLRTADAAFLVWIEALRAGGQVQLEGHVLDVDGRPIAQDETAGAAADVIGGGGVVPPAVLSSLKQALAKAAAGATTTTTTGSTTTGGTNGGGEQLEPEHKPDDEPPQKPLSPAALGGIAALGGGALLALGGAAIAASELNVIKDPASPGADKESAAGVATAMFVLSAAGVGLAGVGGYLLFLGMSEGSGGT